MMMRIIKHCRFSVHSQKRSDINFIYSIPNAHQNNAIGNLYLGSHFGVQKEYLTKFNIKSILTIMEDYEYSQHRIKQRVNELLKEDIISSHRHLILSDPISHFWEIGSNFINQNLQITNVFVHCVYGKSRSPSTVAAFIILKQKLRSAETCRLVEQQRGIRLDQFWKDELSLLQKN